MDRRQFVALVSASTMPRYKWTKPTDAGSISRGDCALILRSSTIPDPSSRPDLTLTCKITAADSQALLALKTLERDAVRLPPRHFWTPFQPVADTNGSDVISLELVVKGSMSLGPSCRPKPCGALLAGNVQWMPRLPFQPGFRFQIVGRTKHPTIYVFEDGSWPGPLSGKSGIAEVCLLLLGWLSGPNLVGRDLSDMRRVWDRVGIYFGFCSSGQEADRFATNDFNKLISLIQGEGLGVSGALVYFDLADDVKLNHVVETIDWMAAEMSKSKSNIVYQIAQTGQKIQTRVHVIVFAGGNP
jgi:hypothetical protein